MDDLARPHAKSTGAGSGGWIAGKSARKNLPRKNPCNPLESLDYDERIQGNPRESNTLKSGF
jgi:hypothetical protein